MAGFFRTIQNIISTILQKMVEVFGVKPPTAIVTGFQIPSIDLHQATLSFSLLLTNPSRLPIPLTDMSYTLETDSRELLSAAVTQAQTIQPNTSATILLPVTLVYQDILETVVDLRPGSVIPYKINVDIAVDAPCTCLGSKTVAFDYSGVFPIPQVPVILLEKMEFRKFSFEECEVSLQLKVRNTNEFEMGISSLECQLQLASIAVGSAGLEKAASVGKSGESWVEIPISFMPRNLGNAVWQVLAGQQASYNISGSIGAETVFGSMKFPFSQGGSATLVK
ncbi:hypothetical protein ACLOJK_009357 [Asimina triloba]